MEKEIKIKINYISYIKKYYVPSKHNLKTWIDRSLSKSFINHVNLIFVGNQRMRSLNNNFLGKNKATNVLTFQYKENKIFFGDIILCPEVINKEAKKYGFDLNFRWAHMIVHSMLHLQGYHHDSKKDQIFMEQKEIKLLTSMKFGNPYVRI
tara:strand:- start:8160 stop:8612 length:453 start_codon:yes stop_codon:yes gene_type:complete